MLVCSIVWSFYFMFGLCLGTTTVAIPQLRREANSTSSVSDDMVSWISSVVGYVGMFWVIGISIIAHHIGRRKTQLMVSVNTFVAFLILYCSKNATYLLVSHILQGMTAASQTITALMTLTEYPAPKYRGLFLTIKSVTLFWGIWIANAIGAFLDFRYIGIFGILCSVYNLIVLFLIPESPYWLASVEKYDECAKSHRWLKGDDEHSERELEVMINSQKEFKRQRKVKKSIRDHICKIIHNLRQPEIHKPVALSGLIMALYYFCGKFACTIYSIQMIKKITDSESTAYAGMLILDGVTIFGMYIGCALSKFLKRRTLLLSATAIGTFFLYIMSIYLYCIKFSLISENNYVSIAILTGFSMSICCGPIILSSALFGELMPVRSRSLCLVLVSFCTKCLLGTVLKISPYMFKSLGYHGTFMFFGVTSTILLIAIYYCLPETKDKTLLEIAEIFKKDKTAKPTELMVLNRNDNVSE